MSSENVEQIPTPAPVTDQPAPARATDIPEPEHTKEPRMNAFKRLEVATDDAQIPQPYKENLALLRDLQVQHLNIEVEYRREWNEMKLRYLAKFQPLYENRRKVLAAKPEGLPVTPAPAAVCGTEGLPDFWLKAMQNNLLLEEMIEEHDVPILSHLKDIVFSWVDPLEQTSFRLDFHFVPNEYFSNSVLSKVYYLERSEDDDDESVLTRTEGTVIDWYPSKNVTQKLISRRQRNKRTNQTRTVTQAIDDNSFFNYFQSHEIPSEEQLGNMDEVDVNELEMIVEAEFEVGSVIRDKIIPRAVGWYLQIEHDDDASEGSGEMHQNFDDDDDDDDDDDE